MLTESRIYWALIFIIFAVSFHFLSPILGPFLFSILLAYLADPMINRLDEYQKRWNRTVAVVTVYILIILFLAITIMVVIPLVSGQLQSLISKLPSFFDFISSKLLPFIHDKIGNAGSIDSDGVTVLKDYVAKFPNILNKILKWITGSADWIFALVANIFLVPVVSFYLMRDWRILVAKFHDLLPRKQEPIIMQIAKESDEMLSAFLRGQFMVMNCLAFIYVLGLSIVGLNFAFLIGLIAGWLSFVPYLGLMIGIGVATVMSYFQFHDVWHPLAVIMVFVVAQMVEGSFLTPRFVGEKIGLHPVAVIFSVLAGGQLAGFSGILLALPVAAVLNVLVRHAQVIYRSSQLYN